MKRYTIARVSGKPDWSAIPALDIDEQLWRPPVDIAAKAQIAWDDARLYVRLQAREAHIRAVHTGSLGMPCEDSCLEFFFSPTPGDPRYFNVEFNPNGALYLGFGDGQAATRLLPERNPAESIRIQRAARHLLPHEPAPPGVPHTCVSCSLSGIIGTNYVEMENVLTSGSAIPLL